MKKRNFCKEVKRIVYYNPKTQTTHCNLDCTIELYPEQETITWDLAKEIEKKYPLLKHQYSDVFTVHIETTAVCREGDTFDEKKGKTIAYSKAQLKLYDLLNRVYNYMEIYFGDRKYEAQEARRMFFRYANREASFLKGL
jgi:hypothetical protein